MDLLAFKFERNIPELVYTVNKKYISSFVKIATCMSIVHITLSSSKHDQCPLLGMVANQVPTFLGATQSHLHVCFG